MHVIGHRNTTTTTAATTTASATATVTAATVALLLSYHHHNQHTLSFSPFLASSAPPLHNLNTSHDLNLNFKLIKTNLCCYAA